MRLFFFAAAAVALVHALSPTGAHAAPAVWRVDRPASRLGFSTTVSGQGVSGAFGRWDADIAFDPADLADSHVTARIDTASVASGDATRDSMLPSPDWFSAKAFPQAVFRSRRITAAGPGRYVAEGDLTIRNVTRPISLPFALVINGDTAKMVGSAPLDRAAFGVGQGQFKGGDTVALKVQVTVNITAHRAH